MPDRNAQSAGAAGRRDWPELWQKPEPGPAMEEIRRAFPIRNPVRWVR